MSIIHDIEIKNFKSIRHQKIEGCKRINVFVGPPNVGKSNILEALGVFSVKNIENGLTFKFDDICRIKRPNELFFNADSRNASEIIINKHSVTAEINLINGLSLKVRFSDINGKGSGTTDINSHSFEVLNGQINPDFKQGFLYDFCKFDFIKNPIDTGNISPSLAMPFGDNLFQVISANGELRKQIVELFKQYRLRLSVDTTDNSFKFQKELDDESFVSIFYHQVADTLQRLIFFKAAIYSHRNKILLLEEPEAHMYGPYISKMTSDIIYDENENQYFITTHSGYVVNDILENAEKGDFAIYVVGYDNLTGETLIRQMSESDLSEMYQYGVDLFMNLESYMPGNE